MKKALIMTFWRKLADRTAVGPAPVVLGGIRTHVEAMQGVLRPMRNPSPLPGAVPLWVSPRFFGLPFEGRQAAISPIPMKRVPQAAGRALQPCGRPFSRTTLTKRTDHV